MPADDPDAPAFSLDARLAALADYGILDTPEETGFDDIVKLAALICHTPVALVSFVEKDRQWFKARVGFEGCETPLNQSVCRHALQQTDLLIIPDLRADPRTSDNPLVTADPFIRFYAGAPLVSPAGPVIGTLCVIDTVPRPQGLTAEQAEALAALARQVMVQLELRRTLAGSEGVSREHQTDSEIARQAHERLVLAEEAGGIGTFEVDIATSEMTVSAEYCRLFGLKDARNYHASVSEALLVAEDREVMSNEQTRKGGSAELNVEYRIRRADNGELRWLARRARFTRGADGKPVKMYGTVTDVTDRHRLQDQQARLLVFSDELRGASSLAQVAALAATVLGETLGVDRAGYGVVDRLAGTLTILDDWATDGLPSIAGEHRLDSMAGTLSKLAQGESLAISNIPATSWLGNDLPRYALAGTVAMIDIPLIDHGELVGVAFAHHSKSRVWRRDEVDFAHSVADSTQATLAKLGAEANQHMLNSELGHRMKNQLALVQAIVGQTLRSAVDMKSANEVLTARIQVLASAHDILIAGAMGRTTVGDIVRNVVLLHDDHDDRRIKVTGPNMIVASRPALSLSLILHELSTNGAKYGALSTPDGFVMINWRVDRNEEGVATFVLDWTEHDGPPVIEPTRKGSGSRLIRAGLSGVADSRVSLEYAPEGLRCEVVGELSSFQTER